MKKLKKLTRAQKKVLAKEGFNSEDYLLERTLPDGFLFYNKNNGVLIALSK